MGCIDRTGRIQDHLLDYVDGVIDPLNRDAVRRHLGECAHCSEVVEELKSFVAIAPLISKSAWGRKTECPSAEEIESLVSGHADFSPDRKEEIKEHLHECFSCTNLLAKVKAINNYLEKTKDSELPDMPPVLKNKVAGIIKKNIKESALSNIPVDIFIDSTFADVDFQAFMEITGINTNTDQELLPVVEKVISGYAKDEDGSFIKHEKVQLIRNDSAVYTINSEPLGRFHFRNLHQGLYAVKIRSTIKYILMSNNGRLR